MEKAKKSFFEKEIVIGGVSLDQKSLFAKHLSIMLKAGVSLTEALAILEKQAKGKMKKVLSKISSSVNSGQKLSTALARHKDTFQGLFVSMVHSGEVSGNLEQSLVSISKQLEKQKDLEDKINTAMLYPSIVSFIALIVGGLVSYFVLPKITPLLKGLTVELPASTRSLIWFADLMKEDGLLILGGLFGLIILLIWLNKQDFSKPFTHWFLIRIPVIKDIIINSELSRLCYTLNSLLGSGVNIDRALKIAKETLTICYFSESLAEVRKRVVKGNKFSGGLKDFKNLYPDILISMVEVGERSGQLDEVLIYLSHFYRDKLDNSVKRLVVTIEPMLLIIIGLLVSFLALAIITPIYKVTGSIKL